MLLALRPKTPKGFNRACRVARGVIRKMVRQGTRPASEDFKDTWSAFKHVLAEAQGHRCGYCDRKVLGGDDGTVDHYWPKAEIHALYDDPATWGTQKDHSASIEGRLKQDVSERGYHWLAYAWRNYVFACSSCNNKWKRTLCPVATHPRVAEPRPKGREEPLLMSCYRSLRPSEHLQFNEDGTVEPWRSSRYGFETIRTVGLYREPLCDERAEVAGDVYQLLRDYADGDEHEQQRAIRDLFKKGNENRSFAGVVRAIVEQELGMTWEALVAL